MQPFRVQPQGNVTDYKTYGIRMPKTAQTRLATCQAADCPNYEQGWQTIVPNLSPQAEYIRNHSGRRFYEESGENGLTAFIFYPGQQCFQQHHVRDRPQFYLKRDGDWRGNPTGRTLRHSGPQSWVDDFGEHLEGLAEQRKKG